LVRTGLEEVGECVGRVVDLAPIQGKVVIRRKAKERDGQETVAAVSAAVCIKEAGLSNSR